MIDVTKRLKNGGKKARYIHKSPTNVAALHLQK